jgi:predicted ester cyclase
MIDRGSRSVVTTEIVQEFIEAILNGRDVNSVGNFLASTFVDHHPWPGHAGTRDGFASGLAEFRAVFPDAQCAIKGIEVEGDMVSVLLIWTGTHNGACDAPVPTPKKFRVQALEMVRVVEGRILERWGFHYDRSLIDLFASVGDHS